MKWDQEFNVHDAKMW